MDSNSIKEGKTLAFVAYITIIGVLIAFFMNQEKKNTFTSFHIRQSLGLWLLYFIFGYVVSGFDSWTLTYAFWICFGILFVYGILGAVTGNSNKVPLLGNAFQNIFRSLK